MALSDDELKAMRATFFNLANNVPGVGPLPQKVLDLIDEASEARRASRQPEPAPKRTRGRIASEDLFYAADGYVRLRVPGTPNVYAVTPIVSLLSILRDAVAVTVDAERKAATADERKRCADIAEARASATAHSDHGRGWVGAARSILDAIREED